MERSSLKDKFNKHPAYLNRQLYNKKRNFCVSSVKKEKRKYYNSLDLIIFQDNKNFWKRVKLLFSDKQKSLERDIILIEDEIVISNRKEVAEGGRHPKIITNITLQTLQTFTTLS